VREIRKEVVEHGWRAHYEGSDLGAPTVSPPIGWMLQHLGKVLDEQIDPVKEDACRYRCRL
jgi:hypothetical protein